ncbi:MAG: hypothetical protein IJZ72_02885 [Oscillospiraceae bacterium]|nr:hypothetical protein [Oscillospiraceae bacterium]
MKNEIKKFALWFRNGFAFCTAWFLILILMYCKLSGRETLSTESLAEMLLWTAGGVLIFCVMFTRLIFKGMSFALRLTVFMLGIGFYECAAFYSAGIFKKTGNAVQWGVFAAVIAVLYGACMLIYSLYSRKQGELYTNALKKYQQERKTENG